MAIQVFADEELARLRGFPDISRAGSADGKDLYDAVLLAECPQTNLTPRLLRTVLGTNARDVTPTAIRDWCVDWTTFLDTHPDIHGDLGDWLDRLVRAIPTPAIRKKHS